MKNLFLTAALVLALSANATSTIVKADTVTAVNQDKQYKKIEASAVPETIQKEVKDKYSGFNISEAYVAEDGSDYKIVVSKDTNAATLWYTAAGEFVKEEKKA